MPSSKQYLDYVLDQLSLTSGVSYKPMMGEYILYVQGKVIGGIYDDRFLLKPTPSAKRMMPNASFEKPYDGAKEMLLVERIDERDFLRELLHAMLGELQPPKRRKPCVPVS